MIVISNPLKEPPILDVLKTRHFIYPYINSEFSKLYLF